MRKKITLLTISLIKGGAEHQLVKLAVHLKQNGHEVTIIAVLPDNDFEEILEKHKIKYKLIPLKKGIGFFALNSFFRKQKADILISFMFGANMVARALKMFNNVPLITSVRNNEIGKKFYYLYKLTHKIDTLTTFNSAYSLSKFISEKLTVAQNSHLVNNSIEIKKGLEREESSNKKFTFVSMAHFRPQKDYRTLFEAIDVLVKKGVNVKLFVLGHLYNQNWPYTFIKNNKLEENIEMVGFVKNTKKYLQDANAVVLSSLWEGTPNALLEGMAHKLPVISSEIPGCKELIEISKSGFLFEKGNANDLVKKVELLLALKDEERNKLAMNGYQHVLENYEATVVYKKWDELIDLALKKNN